MRGLVKVVDDILQIPDLRRRLFITFGLLAIYRIGFHIYLPGVDAVFLHKVIEVQQSTGGGLLGYIQMASLLTGGSLSQAMIFSLGIMPYISASIIFSLLVKVFPKLEALQKEGESGRRQINRYTRYATVLLCIIQGMFVVAWLSSPAQAGTMRQSISAGGLPLQMLQLTVLTAGTLFLMWLGEKISEFGIGNGTSLIIMAGIIAEMPGAILTMVRRTLMANPDERALYVVKLIVLFALFVGIVASVVLITKGQRRIPLQHARHVKGRRMQGGQRMYFPIRINSAGVLPIIFAQSLILIPTLFLTSVFDEGNFLVMALNRNGFWYLLLNVLMIGFFTYFWTSLMFNPVEIAENMKEHGSFIPGIRPGRRTAEYLQQIINRVTLTGAVFLATIALIPQIIADAFEVDLLITSFLGGTGILIVVGVALDLVDKIEAQLLVRHYEGFMRAADDRAKA
ncbi:MAG: preprotein translocase subunit SecY [Planctomycetes bacterium]|nr:preprotein translocase subunit SecY [Planctomycetota bacterium]